MAGNDFVIPTVPPRLRIALHSTANTEISRVALRFRISSCDGLSIKSFCGCVTPSFSFLLALFVCCELRISKNENDLQPWSPPPLRVRVTYCIEARAVKRREAVGISYASFENGQNVRTWADAKGVGGAAYEKRLWRPRVAASFLLLFFSRQLNPAKRLFSLHENKIERRI